MKKCYQCGRENDDRAIVCQRCSYEFVPQNRSEIPGMNPQPRPEIGSEENCGKLLRGSGQLVSACLRCGSEGRQEWPRTGRPNPLPEFERPDDFYTSFLLPGSYLPLPVESLQVSGDSTLYVPLTDDQQVDRLFAFILHENIHHQFLHGIVPSLIRLTAARFYLSLVLLVNSLPALNSKTWGYLQAHNDLIMRLVRATQPVYEAVANRYTAGSSVPGHGHARAGAKISAESIAFYAKAFKENKFRTTGLLRNLSYDDAFELLWGALNSAVDNLATMIQPAAVQHETLIALCEFAVSSVVKSKEIRADILAGPAKIGNHELEPYLRAIGDSYRPSARMTAATPTVCYPYHIEDGTNQLFQALFSLIIHTSDIPGKDKYAGERQAFQPRRRAMDSVTDQLLYLANIVPGFRQWLLDGEELIWLGSRMVDAIREIEMILARQTSTVRSSGQEVSWSVPLLDAWEGSVARDEGRTLEAFMFMKTGVAGRALSVGKPAPPEDALWWDGFKRIPDKRYFAYGCFPNAPIGLAFGPGVGRVRPEPIILNASNSLSQIDSIETVVADLKRLILLESFRQQLSIGCGVSCPFGPKGGRCCGFGARIWQFYEVGFKAANEKWWIPAWWKSPEAVCHSAFAS